MNAKKRLMATATSIILVISMSMPAFAAAGDGLVAVPDPIDPQSWRPLTEMTWDDFKPNPVIDWLSEEGEAIAPETTIRGALILCDFPDQPFISTLPKGSDVLGNPITDPIPTSELAEWWANYLNTPSELNHGATINAYWRENSFGKWKIEVEAYGPYTMPYPEFQYGLADGSGFETAADRPAGFTPYRAIQTDAVNMAIAKKEIDFSQLDFAFIVHAGYDESGVWQEAGEMMWMNRDEIDPKFGALEHLNKMVANGLTVPQAAFTWANAANGKLWASTRYVPWTSWFSAKAIWSYATSTSLVRGRLSGSFRLSVQGESDGMGVFAHEFGHIRTMTDNYNYPYNNPPERTYSGCWDIMAQGSSNGPGGNHARWQIPALMGAGAPANMMIRSKLSSGMKFLTTDDVVDVKRVDLEAGTPVVAEILARNIPTGDAFGIYGPRGLRVIGQDLKPTFPLATENTVNPPNEPYWQNDTYLNGGSRQTKFDGFTVEVSGQTGYDSFTPDHGVLISKYKTAEVTNHTWIVDAHPQDINIVNFVRPDGTPSYLSYGDQYQIADAAFHAGTAEDVVNEYVDTYNSLHFYILDKIETPAQYGDVLSYQVAVRSLKGQAVDGSLDVAAEIDRALPGNVAVANFEITNTGSATDIIRVAFSGDMPWNVTLLNNLYAIGAGETISVPFYIEVPEDLDIANISVNGLTLTASSETNPDKVASVTFDDATNDSVMIYAEDFALTNTATTLNKGKAMEIIPVFSPINTTIQDIIWTSSNTNVATVEDGIVTAVKAGTVVITATSVDGGFVKKVTIRVM